MEKILERTNDNHLIHELDKSDKSVKNVWRWQWMEETVPIKVGTTEKTFSVGEWIRKIDKPGMAKCLLCCQPLAYGKRGRPAITKHCTSAGHVDKVKAQHKQTSLPASFGGQKADDGKQYGIHPMFFSKKTGQPPQQPETVKRPVPLEDRIVNAEATLLAFVAEHSLPLTMAPHLISLAKELGKDKKVLDSLSMDRTTASYKLTHGLQKTLFGELVEHLKEGPFSLNIDESTASNNKHILAVLVNYFNREQNKVVCEHLAAVEVVTVNTESIYMVIVELVESNNIPWENLISILMDSCAVMRGARNGLEVRIRREKCPHLLDIDGDLCHHIHNCAKKFCSPFSYWVENLFVNVHNDHKWSVDLRTIIHHHLIQLMI